MPACKHIQEAPITKSLKGTGSDAPYILNCTIMKYLLLCIFSLISIQYATAQAAKPDRLFKTDNTNLDVKVEEITDTHVVYRLFTTREEPIQRISKEDVVLIIFSNGYTETFGKPQAKPADNKSNDPLQNANSQLKDKLLTQETPSAETAQVKAKPKAAKKKNTVLTPSGEKPRFNLLFTPTAAYMLGGKEWYNTDAGFGFRQGYGGQLLLQYSASDNLTLYLTPRYTRWQVIRGLEQNNSQHSTLHAFSGMLGLKHFLNAVLYIGGEAGTQYLRLTEHLNPNSDSPLPPDIRTIGYRPAAGLSIGTQICINPVVLDIAPNINYIYTNSGDPKGIIYAGFRIGAGLSAGKR